MNIYVTGVASDREYKSIEMEGINNPLRSIDSRNLSPLFQSSTVTNNNVVAEQEYQFSLLTNLAEIIERITHSGAMQLLCSLPADFREQEIQHIVSKNLNSELDKLKSGKDEFESTVLHLNYSSMLVHISEDQEILALVHGLLFMQAIHPTFIIDLEVKCIPLKKTICMLKLSRNNVSQYLLVRKTPKKIIKEGIAALEKYTQSRGEFAELLHGLGIYDPSIIQQKPTYIKQLESLMSRPEIDAMFSFDRAVSRLEHVVGKSISPIAQQKKTPPQSPNKMPLSVSRLIMASAENYQTEELAVAYNRIKNICLDRTLIHEQLCEWINNLNVEYSNKIIKCKIKKPLELAYELLPIFAQISKPLIRTHVQRSISCDTVDSKRISEILVKARSLGIFSEDEERFILLELFTKIHLDTSNSFKYYFGFLERFFDIDKKAGVGLDEFKTISIHVITQIAIKLTLAPTKFENFIPEFKVFLQNIASKFLILKMDDDFLRDLVICANMNILLHIQTKQAIVNTVLKIQQKTPNEKLLDTFKDNFDSDTSKSLKILSKHHWGDIESVDDLYFNKKLRDIERITWHFHLFTEDTFRNANLENGQILLIYENLIRILLDKDVTASTQDMFFKLLKFSLNDSYIERDNSNLNFHKRLSPLLTLYENLKVDNSYFRTILKKLILNITIGFIFTPNKYESSLPYIKNFFSTLLNKSTNSKLQDRIGMAELVYNFFDDIINRSLMKRAIVNIVLKIHSEENPLNKSYLEVFEIIFNSDRSKCLKTLKQSNWGDVIFMDDFGFSKDIAGINSTIECFHLFKEDNFRNADQEFYQEMLLFKDLIEIIYNNKDGEEQSTVIIYKYSAIFLEVFKVLSHCKEYSAIHKINSAILALQKNFEPTKGASRNKNESRDKTESKNDLTIKLNRAKEAFASRQGKRY